jgi:hypothetical protein
MWTFLVITCFIAVEKNFRVFVKLSSTTFLDSHEQPVQTTVFKSKQSDLTVEFISRSEGLHKIFLYVNKALFNARPFTVFISGDTSTLSSNSGANSSSFYVKSSSNNLSFSSSNDLATSFSGNSLTSDSQLNNVCHSADIGHNKILCSRTGRPFHYVLSNKNIQGLSVYGLYRFLFVVEIF